MPYKRGAPFGNQNRFKHGRFALPRIDLRRAARRAIREARQHLANIRVLESRLRVLEALEALREAGTLTPDVAKSARELLELPLPLEPASTARTPKSGA